MPIVLWLAGKLGISKWLIIGVAVLLLALAIIGGIVTIYLEGKKAGRNECQTAVLEETLKDTKRKLQVAEDLNAADKERAIKAEQEVSRLEELVNATPTNATACLPSDAVKRVFDIK
jgi:flagellar basal body-associated protein FliL